MKTRYLPSKGHLAGFIAAALMSIAFGGAAEAHSGGLDASGCHKQKSTGERHCHRDGGEKQPKLVAKTKEDSAQLSSDYDRDLYDHWIDEDGDCLNTRHETLAQLSTGTVHFAKSGCSVSRGRWNDPYTGLIFTDARDLDIDHMVPLAWAHAHGGFAWSPEQRRQFANDARNLFAVEASVNRQKGAQGPTEWLPPNPSYRCEYVTRFIRIVKIYGLEMSANEAAATNHVWNTQCGKTN
jgi:hypothetical protein